MARILIHGFSCDRCNYRWAPRASSTPDETLPKEPKFCPNCKSAYWNRPRQLARAPELRAALWTSN